VNQSAPDTGAALKDDATVMNTAPETPEPSTEQETAADTQAPSQKDTLAVALSQNETPEQAEAAGNYSLAAQLRMQQQFARESLEENDFGSTDVSDGEMSYSASVARSQGGYYKSAYAHYFNDDWEVDDDGFTQNGYDDYGFFNRAFDDAQNAQTQAAAVGVAPATPGFMSSFLSGVAHLAHTVADKLSLHHTPAPQPATSSFADLSSPVSPTGQPVASTSFSNPVTLQALTLANDNANSVAIAIAPTNPNYKPASKTTGLTV
jgi:hypothetical protein